MYRDTRRITRFMPKRSSVGEAILPTKKLELTESENFNHIQQSNKVLKPDSTSTVKFKADLSICLLVRSLREGD